MATNSKHGLAFIAGEINPGERSERALFPEGRGLGVGRKRKKKKKNRKEIQPTHRSGMGLRAFLKGEGGEVVGREPAH